MSIKNWWKSGILALVLCSQSFAQQDKIIMLNPDNPLSNRLLGEADREEFIWHMIGIAYKYARRGNHLSIVRRMSKTEVDIYHKVLQRVNNGDKITPMQMEYVDKITCGTYEIYLLDHVDWSVGKERTKAIKDYFSYELETLNYLHQDDEETDDEKIRQLARFAKRETEKFEKIFNSIDPNSIDIQIVGLSNIIDPEKKREYEVEVKRIEREREEAKVRYDQEMMRRFGPIDR